MKKITISDIFLILFASAFLAVTLLPYPAFKQVGNFFASDGNLERLTETNALYFRLIFALLFIACTGFVIWGIWNKKGRREFTLSLFKFPSRCINDAKLFFKSLKRFFSNTPKWAVISITVVLLLGTLLRFLLLDRPLLHDEAYTMFTWGRSDLPFAISDYHLPNNHILNTIFVNLIYHLGARSAWLLRIPVFISGILLIFFTWLLGKYLYNDFAGITAATFVAFFPYIVEYSVNARGYEIQALLTVLSVGLALYAKRRNNSFSWFLLVIISSLNFFTIPTSLYPFGGICLWLIIEGISKKGKERKNIIIGVVFTIVFVAILTTLLYSPLITHSGIKSLFGNVFIKPVEKSIFLSTLYTRIKESADVFFGSVPRLFSVILLMGIILSSAAFKKYTEEKLSPLTAMLFFLIIIIPLQRPNLWPRTLLYLYPLILISAAGGLYWLTETGTFRYPFMFVVFLSAAAAAAPQFVNAIENFGVPGSNEKAIWQILAKEGKNAKNIYIATVSEDNAPLWMYADFYGLPEKIFDRTKPFNKVYIYVNPSNDTENGARTLEEVLAAEGPGNQFIDFDSMKNIIFLPDCLLYSAEAQNDIVEKEYQKGVRK